MADFLLIHGSCHGAWCWDQVVALLRTKGHSARAIDLPGHGADTTPVAKVTLARYGQAIAAACGPHTVLVGHSMGGYAITAAACLVPERIRKLIYLCAYVPQPGLSLAQMRKLAPTQPLLRAMRMTADGIGFTIDPDMAPEVFYHDCAADLTQAAIARLCVQPVAPTNMPFEGTPAQAALPRHYIRCTDDRAVPPAFQITMTRDWPATDVQDMECGHSPFFADPEGLVRCLETASET